MVEICQKQISLTKFINKLVERECPHDNIKIIDIKLIHAIDVGSFALHHKDPFECMIITQAAIENLTIVTSDTIFQKYDVSILF